eukprot:TRINITY_DN5215_c0_g1_i1.p1 TRINITY_DN5215_c0_g1~~TRINITY_DN5215_c0_g1_i1.p1  ORF type:complete len:145 (+),score=36.77 TRINITY_DN5215_c0_g1_i1:144-578(+)
MFFLCCCQRNSILSNEVYSQLEQKFDQIYVNLPKCVCVSLYTVQGEEIISTCISPELSAKIKPIVHSFHQANCDLANNLNDTPKSSHIFNDNSILSIFELRSSNDAPFILFTVCNTICNDNMMFKNYENIINSSVVECQEILNA